jgi:hypothetical protein
VSRAELAVGQRYQSCDPRDSITIRVDQWTPGHDRAWVVDAVTGKRGRWIQVKSLHLSGTTDAGAPRRTGYRLISA